MKCDEVREQIDLQLKCGSHDLEPVYPVYKEHLDSCEGCREYYDQAVRLAELLNSQKFEILPGELDDLTFEKIVASARPVKKSGYLRNIFSIRWAWVPAAAAAIFILFTVFPGRVNHDTESGTVKIIDWSPPFSTYVPTGLDSTAFSSFNIDDNDLEILEEEILYNSDVDNIIESLTDEELDILYERINSKGGSTG